jgi:hypothetical protein
MIFNIFHIRKLNVHKQEQNTLNKITRFLLFFQIRNEQGINFTPLLQNSTGRKIKIAAGCSVLLAAFDLSPSWGGFW